MKPGVRALGVAESYGAGLSDSSPATSTLAGVVARAEGTVDGFVFGDCTVGGLDSTDAIIELVDRLDRPDVQYLFVAGVALAWYNFVDPERLHEATGLPVLAITFEDSDGLEPALSEAFDGGALQKRLDRYRSLPPRTAYDPGGDSHGPSADQPVYVRSVGAADPGRVLSHFTRSGRRPEPVRIARQAARAADYWRSSGDRPA